MTLSPPDEPITKKPLRLWPGVVIAALQFVAMFGVPLFAPEVAAFGMLGANVGGVLIVLWWAFFSRATVSERWGAIVLMVVAMLATSRLIHMSIATGMMGMMFIFCAIPTVTLALVIWAVATRRLPDKTRRATLVATILLASGGWTLVRTGGFTGGGHNDFAWRWSKTPEERLLAQGGDEPATVKAPSPPATASPSTALVKTGADWPGFRGPGRDGIARGMRIETNWATSPPVELWRRPIGPGWSSFAVRGDLFYTQEQRGDDEEVACYQVSTGKPVWRHRDAARFWESNAGAGPRATPTLSQDRVYSFGATGILNALNAADGKLIWSRNVAKEIGATIPGWGFSSSPLVVGDVVVVHAHELAAYDLATGAPRWTGAVHRGSYSSPHLMTIDGVAQIVMMSGAGAASVSPTDGKQLWEQPWEGTPIVQPAQLADDAVLITTGGGMGGIGIRRLAITHAAGAGSGTVAGWNIKEVWTSNGLKPYFNDFAVHKGHAFGFDGATLSCIDLADGKRLWKGGRYGNGQFVLLADQDLLLVLSESGELALVSATPDQFTELARFPAIKGKTWNHPVLAGDILLVRNGEEMAAFRLAAAR
jgi:outer membrane protein assembly factor BamB